MGRIAAIVAAFVLLLAGAVFLSLRQPPPPAGYSGLEFADMTRGAEARTPLLKHGVLVLSVAPQSPADKAGIAAGDVVAAIDGVPVASARQAGRRIRSYAMGQSATLTLYDVANGEVKPRKLPLIFAAAPDPAQTGKYSVKPPRVVAREAFALPPIAANAAWTRRISRGAFIKPQPLYGLGAGRCNGVAPERWHVAGFAADGSLIHVMAPVNFEHAALLTAPLAGAAPADFIRNWLTDTFRSPATLAPPAVQPFGFVLRRFGNAHGGAGLVEYRIEKGRIQMWVAAVAAAEAGWALPVTAAVAFSLNCGGGDRPHDPRLAATSVSGQCLAGKCQDSDFAAVYLKTLRVGYVHDPEGLNYLVNPRRDLWANGAQGPGYYHQVSGVNEKLEPGRTN
jgi:hypothetical protein